MTNGKWVLKSDGKWGIASSSGKWGLKSDDGDCGCCVVCEGSPANPESFTEVWDDAADWTETNPVSGFAAFETLTYNPTLFVESSGDATDDYRATWERAIRKVSASVDSMRIGLSVPVRSNWTSDIVSPFPQRSVFVTIELKYGSTSILKIACSYTASEFAGSAVNTIAWTGTGGYSYSPSGSPFVDGVDVEIVWTRLSATTFNIKAYKDGSLLNTSSTGTISVENDTDFGCELDVIQTIDHINIHVGSTLETQVDDTFAEIVSS